MNQSRLVWANRFCGCTGDDLTILYASLEIRRAVYCTLCIHDEYPADPAMCALSHLSLHPSGPLLVPITGILRWLPDKFSFNVCIDLLNELHSVVDINGWMASGGTDFWHPTSMSHLSRALNSPLSVLCMPGLPGRWRMACLAR